MTNKRTLEDCSHCDIVSFRERESPVDFLDCYRVYRLEELHNSRTLGTMTRYCKLKPVCFQNGQWQLTHLGTSTIKNWSEPCFLVKLHEKQLMAGDPIP